MLVNYIFEYYSMYPSFDEMVLVGRAMVGMFTKLQDDKGGVVSSEILESRIINRWNYSTLSHRILYIIGYIDFFRSDF